MFVFPLPSLKQVWTLSWHTWSLVGFTWQQCSRLTCLEPHKHAASWHQNSEEKPIQGVSHPTYGQPGVLGWQLSVLIYRVGGSISPLYTPVINCSTSSLKSQQWQLSQEIPKVEVCGCLLSWVEIISSLQLDCSYSTPSCCPRLCEDWDTSPVSRCQFPQFSQRWHDIMISSLLILLLLSGHWEDNKIHVSLIAQWSDRIRAYELSAVTIICPSLSWKAIQTHPSLKLQSLWGQIANFTNLNL